MKTNCPIMDYVRDQNPRPLYRVDALAGTPDYVTQAEVITPEHTQKLASVAFADHGRREFPCFDKASTYLSYAYLRGAGRSDPALETRIKQAGQVFGISEDLEKIDAALATEKSASAPEPRFALPAGSVKEANFNLYPINSREEIESSGHQLLHDRSRMPVHAFRTAASALVKAAAEHPGTQLPEKVHAAGVARFPNFEFAAQVAGNRKFVVKSAEALELYAELVKSAHASDETEAVKFATLWTELDSQFGVKYANGIVDPWAAIFSGPTVEEVEKMASTFAFVAGTPVPLATLQAIPEEKLTQSFSTKTAGLLVATRTKSAAELTSLVSAWDRPVQKELLRLAVAV